MSGLNVAAVREVHAAAKPQRRKATLEQRMLGIMAAFAVTWGILCLLMFTLFMAADEAALLKQYTPAQVEYLQNTPVWANFAKAMAAIGMLCGAVYLLLRRKSAYHWFMISLVGTLMVMLDSGLRGGFDMLGSMGSGVNIGMIIVAIFLFWASYSAFNDGQLNDE